MRTIDDAGVICVCALTAPSEQARLRMAGIIGEGSFIVVHLSAPIEVCRERHAGALYRLADSGEIANVPGVSSPYEEPRSPALAVPTHEIALDESANRVLAMLESRGIIGA